MLIVAAVAFWPDTPVNASSVVIVPPKAYGSQDVGEAAEIIPPALASHLKEIPGMEVKVSSTESGDIAVLTTLTSDSGILQLNIEVIDTRTRKGIWGNAYQSPRSQYTEMLRVAGEGLRRALD